MKLDEIQQLWENDCKIDRTELGEESLRIPQLHSRYYNIFSQERMSLRRLEGTYKQLYLNKYELYNGTLSKEQLDDLGWQPNPLKILKTDIPTYIDGDVDIHNMQMRIEMQKEKVEFLESIIKSLSTRGYQIKSAIDWVKFQSGL